MHALIKFTGRDQPSLFGLTHVSDVARLLTMDGAEWGVCISPTGHVIVPGCDDGGTRTAPQRPAADVPDELETLRAEAAKSSGGITSAEFLRDGDIIRGDVVRYGKTFDIVITGGVVTVNSEHRDPSLSRALTLAFLADNHATIDADAATRDGDYARKLRREALDVTGCVEARFAQPHGQRGRGWVLHESNAEFNVHPHAAGPGGFVVTAADSSTCEGETLTAALTKAFAAAATARTSK